MLNWFKYSGCNITLKLNPFHWRLAVGFSQTNEAWETDFFYLELLPITVRLWFDNGDW